MHSLVTIHPELQDNPLLQQWEKIELTIQLFIPGL